MADGTQYTQSVWAANSRRSPAVPPLPGPADSEVAIIGGGFTGLSAAHHLWQVGVPAIVLEANDIGFGASGRSGAMAVLRYKRGFSALALAHGDEVAARLHSLAVNAVDTLEAIVKTHGLDCDFRRFGHITAASSDAAMQELLRDIEWLERVVGDRIPRAVHIDEMRELTGTSVYRGGYLDSRAAGIQPFDFVRGLAASLVEKGVRIHARTPVTGISGTDGNFTLQTPRGTVNAKKVLVATNAYTDLYALGVDLSRRVVPVASSVIATAPLSPELAASVLPERHLLTDTRKLTNYFRMLPDNRLVFGGRGDLLGRDAPASYRGLEQLLVTTFPKLLNTRIEYRWSGKVAVTLDDFPHIGAVRPGLHFAVGCGGRGVALMNLMGKLLAKWVGGEQPEAGPMSDAAFPPIPFHMLRVPAMQAIATYYKWLDVRSTRVPSSAVQSGSCG